MVLCGVVAEDVEGVAELEAESRYGTAAKSSLDVGMEGRWNIGREPSVRTEPQGSMSQRVS